MQEVIQAYATPDYKVTLYFADGHIKLFDANKLKEQGVFQKLKDLDFFLKACTVMNRTLAWDLSGKFDPTNCLDLDPDVLYQQCSETCDPLEKDDPSASCK